MSRISEALNRAGNGDALTPVDDLTAGAVAVADLPLGAASTEPASPMDDTPLASSTRVHPQSVTPASSSSELLDAVAANLDHKLVANPALQPVAIEQYRRLAAILHHTQEGRGIRKVLVASALAEEGKTLTAINLALTLSQSYGKRVLLVDADMRRPGVSHVFGLPATGGLTEALNRPEPGKLALVRLSDNLAVLPAGHATRDPMAGLSSPRLGTILDEASQAFDWVIVDSPPVGVMSDAKLLAGMVDAALLVIAAGRTPFAALQRATDAIGRERLLGVVLNRVDESTAAPGHYYYYRYYGDTPRGSRKAGLFARLTGRA